MPWRHAVAGIDGSPEGKFAVLASDKPKTAARILIAYFSRVGTSKSFAGVDAVSFASLPQGNTIMIAKMIHEVVGGDMFQIVTVNPYPADYHETTILARREQTDNARPKLSTHVAHMNDYDTIFLGCPIWWGRMPMAILSFLEEYNLSGKTIIPFCTHGGSGLGSSEKDIAALCPRSRLLRSLAISGSSASLAQNQVSDWLADLGYR
jgi:flavodoxin